jgi:hypothetical protein
MKVYVHHIPGRLRVRIPSLRKNPCRIDEIKALFQHDGVLRTTVNPLTGSVVILYDPKQTAGRNLLDRLKSRGYLQKDQMITMDAKMKTVSDKAAEKVSKALFGWAVGRVLESNGLSLIAAFI